MHGDGAGDIRVRREASVWGKNQANGSTCQRPVVLVERQKEAIQAGAVHELLRRRLHGEARLGGTGADKIRDATAP